MIKTILYSFIFCYHERFRAESFLDVRMRRTCQVIRRKRLQSLSAKLVDMNFPLIFLAKSLGGKCH